MVETNGFFAIDRETHKIVRHVSVFSNSDPCSQIYTNAGEKFVKFWNFANYQKSFFQVIKAPLCLECTLISIITPKSTKIHNSKEFPVEGRNRKNETWRTSLCISLPIAKKPFVPTVKGRWSRKLVLRFLVFYSQTPTHLGKFWNDVSYIQVGIYTDFYNIMKDISRTLSVRKNANIFGTKSLNFFFLINDVHFNNFLSW